MDAEDIIFLTDKIDKCRDDIKEHIESKMVPMAKLVDGHLKWHTEQRKEKKEANLIKKKFYLSIIGSLIFVCIMGFCGFAYTAMKFWTKMQLGINGN